MKIKMRMKNGKKVKISSCRLHRMHFDSPPTPVFLPFHASMLVQCARRGCGVQRIRPLVVVVAMMDAMRCDVMEIIPGDSSEKLCPHSVVKKEAKSKRRGKRRRKGEKKKGQKRMKKTVILFSLFVFPFSCSFVIKA